MQTQDSSLQDKKTDSIIFKTALFSIAATTVLGSTLIAPSLPALEKHFSDVQNIDFLSKLILTLPALFIMIFSPISGFMLERFGRLKLIYPSLVVWSVMGTSGFFLDNIYLLLISRAIFGIATAFLMTGVSVLLSDYYTGIKREKALSLQGFFMAFGGAVFLMMGGYLSNIDWRYPFLAYLLGIAIMILAIFVLFEPVRHSIEKKDTHIKENFDFVKFVPVYLLGVFCMAMFYVAPTQLPSFIINTLQMNGSKVGISMAVASVSMAIFSLFYNRLRSYLSIFKIYFLALFLIGSSFMAVGIFHNYPMTLVAFVLMGAGLGFMMVNNSSWLFKLAKDTEKAKAYGFLAASLFMGQFISPIITQPVVNSFGLIKMFCIFGGLMYVIALLFLVLKSKH
ncbi:MFS transporter [Helicobacter cappadocius]|uniref:MFS transporter n=1 Tax=Helicobacter cappadocius TaxID=3063998 RepID=A0AA90PK70_9HELI|nr:MULTISPECIES: MFS transporter [unclassified Helicobacter]MDO7252970.1 MFS transporter [Helicobacter sp. faydin-H75]MDP2539040.1 MFS transporter [Helicobacter sp. faydin-H76]